MKKVLSYIFGVIMILSALAHIFSPEAYAPMIPDFIPESVANILAALAEGVTGIALFIPIYRKKGGLLFAGLMLAFLPIHVWDLLRENPAIGPAPAPAIRLVVQFLLIYAGWWIYRKH